MDDGQHHPLIHVTVTPMDLDDWCDLDLAYLLLFDEHPDLDAGDQ